MRGPIPGFRTHVLTALAGTFIAVAVFILFLWGGRSLPTVSSQYQVRAVIGTSSSLSADSRVTEAGVQVGTVESVKRDGADAIVTFSLDAKASPIPVDSHVALTLDTLLGEKTIALTPGVSSRMLPTAGLLGITQASEFTDVDQILSALHGVTRVRAEQAIDGLGGAVNGRGKELNGLLEGLSGTITNGSQVMATLAHDHQQVAAIVSNVASLAEQIGQRGTAITQLADNLNTTFTALGARDAAMGQVIDQLPATFAQVRATSAVIDRTAATTAPVLVRAARAVRDLAPTVHDLTPAADEGRVVVSTLGAASPRLQSTLTALQKSATPLVRALPALKSTLCQVNPAIRYLVPYDRDIGSLIENLGSVVNDYDNNGHIARLAPGVGPNSLFGTLPAGVTGALDTLENSKLLSKITLQGYNPYPAPGDADGTTVGLGTSGPADDSQPYPHVTADC